MQTAAMPVLARTAWVLLALLCAGRAGGQNDDGRFAGVATVIDGDTIEIHGRRIRFHGIDAPEAGQTCTRGDEIWPCGRRAAQALSAYLGHRTIECRAEKIDRYGRIDARCTVEGMDVETWLVREGWALAYRRYSSDYVGDEADARAALRNIWSGAMVPPERYRREHEAATRAGNRY